MEEENNKYYKLWLHEDELIINRLTWLIGSQALLFACYAVMLTAKKSELSVSLATFQAAQKWLPYLGIIIAALILIGIIAAIASCYSFLLSAMSYFPYDP